MTTAARSVVVLTGAGVSADSGVPTFRDAGGLWEGHRVEDVATPAAWRRDPALVWRFYQLRRAALARVTPNAAHVALARLQRELGQCGVPVTLVSQNVDDLHRRTGAEVLDMHGQLRRLACEACSARAWNDEDVDPERFLACAACGHAPLRPDVVWFGEVPHELDRVHAALARCTHFLCIGTSGVVYPAAGFLALARSLGARCVLNALEAPENLAPGDEFRAGRAAEVVPALVEEWLAELGPSNAHGAPYRHGQK
jgi:NAD-dependent deacetylase